MEGFQDNHLDFLSGLEEDSSYFMPKSIAAHIGAANMRTHSFLIFPTELYSAFPSSGITISNFGGNYSRLC